MNIFPLSLTILGITLPRCRHINLKQNLESKIDHLKNNFPLSLTILGITLSRCRQLTYQRKLGNLKSKEQTTYNGQGGGKPTVFGQRGL